MDEIICYCSGVSKKEIWNALENGGETIDDIRKMTEACTLGKCKELSPYKKCCSPNILAIIEEFKSQKDS